MAADVQSVIEKPASAMRPLQDQAIRAVLDGRDSVVCCRPGREIALLGQAAGWVRGEITVDFAAHS